MSESCFIACQKAVSSLVRKLFQRMSESCFIACQKAVSVHVRKTFCCLTECWFVICQSTSEICFGQIELTWSMVVPLTPPSITNIWESFANMQSPSQTSYGVHHKHTKSMQTRGGSLGIFCWGVVCEVRLQYVAFCRNVLVEIPWQMLIKQKGCW